ncbi:MAG: hypothetical protein HY718_06805, partial [Planctomycetes bacterium]|nr:hypothetical protein [Planctomycetota bacterium]
FPAGTLTESLPTGRVISEQPLDYVTNGFGFAGQSGGGQGLTRIERVPQPGRLIYVTEVNRDNDIVAFKLHDLLKPQQLWDSNEARMINDTRHPVALSSSLTIVYKKGARTVAMGSANALFFDGHAACPRIDQMRLSWFTPYAK